MAQQPETEHWPAWASPVICTIRLSFQDSKPVWYLHWHRKLRLRQGSEVSTVCKRRQNLRSGVFKQSWFSYHPGGPRSCQGYWEAVGHFRWPQHHRIHGGPKEPRPKTSMPLCYLRPYMGIVGQSKDSFRLNFSLPSIFWALRSGWIRVAYRKASILVNTPDWLPITLHWIARKLDASFTWQIVRSLSSNKPRIQAFVLHNCEKCVQQL